MRSLFPWRCPDCGDIVDGCGLCAKCWLEIRFLGTACEICAEPMDFSGVCSFCTANPPAFSTVKAAIIYDKNSKLGDHLIALPWILLAILKKGNPN